MHGKVHQPTFQLWYKRAQSCFQRLHVAVYNVYQILQYISRNVCHAALDSIMKFGGLFAIMSRYLLSGVHCHLCTFTSSSVMLFARVNLPLFSKLLKHENAAIVARL